VKLGILDVQGDISEHLVTFRKAIREAGLDAHVESVRTPQAIADIDALVIPGGESTTVSMLMSRFGLDDALEKRIPDIPIFGTCAGLVLMCKKGAKMKAGQKTLSLLDAKVIRNAFGRQVDSFEAPLDIPAIGDEPFHGVFIRAPAIESVWGDCESLAEYNGLIVLARQGNMLASAFHPELTDDLRLHHMFLEMIQCQ